METKLYCSHKLLNTYKSIKIEPLPSAEEQAYHMNSWNVNYLVYERKKIWFFVHSITRYTVLIPDVKASDLPVLRDRLLLHLDKQFNTGVASHGPKGINLEKAESLIGPLKFHPTNNDKSCISYLNQRMESFRYYHHMDMPYGEIDFDKVGANFSFICGMKRGNRSVNIYPSEEMHELIKRWDE